MTTIAYKDGIIAYDSRAYRSGLIESDNCDKKLVVNGVVYIYCGSLADIGRFTEIYGGKEGYEKKKGDENIDIESFVIDDGILYNSSVCQEEGFWRMRIDWPFSIGSGKRHAFTAMDMGATAKEAVKWAMKRDTGTGGRIRTYKINQ